MTNFTFEAATVLFVQSHNNCVFHPIITIQLLNVLLINGSLFITNESDHYHSKYVTAAVKVFQTRFIAPAKEVTCFHPVS